MEQRLLQGAGLTVSRACLETMTFGAQADRETARGILHCALESGVNFIDTANVYAGGASRVEQLSENLKALAEGALEPRTVSGCDEVWRMLKGVGPKYNR
jgi:aryl-alcohol dehydrogenase-like predicted oxidoreductase